MHTDMLFSEDYADCTIKTLFDKADKHMYENKAVEKAKIRSNKDAPQRA